MIRRARIGQEWERIGHGGRKVGEVCRRRLFGRKIRSAVGSKPGSAELRDFPACRLHTDMKALRRRKLLQTYAMVHVVDLNAIDSLSSLELPFENIDLFLVLVAPRPDVQLEVLALKSTVSLARSRD